MASRFWVGGNGNWDASSTANWSATSGGATGASVPTISDDVLFDASSGVGTATITVVANCRSLDCTGYTGGLTLNNAGQFLNIGDASGGALKFVAGMTLTYTAGLGINFSSTSTNGGVGWPITSGGKTIPVVVFNGVGGKWTFQDTMNFGTNTISLTQGTLDTNSQTVTAASFSSSNANIRTLTMGASPITLTAVAGTSWNTTASTNLTLNAGTSTLTISTNPVFASTNVLNNLIWNALGASGSFSFNGGGATFANVTFTGSGNKVGGLSFSGNFTVTGTFTATGNSAINRIIFNSTTVGAPRTITAAAVSLTNVDFMDITGAGAAAPFTGTSLGDCQGNSGITFDAPVTIYRSVAGSSNWSDNTHWSSSSGGAGNTTRVPLPQDIVMVDGNNTSGTLTADMPRLGKDINFTGYTTTFSFSISCTMFGSLTWASGMTISGGVNFFLQGRGSHTITSSGKQNPGTYIIGSGGTYTLQDALSVAGSLSLGGSTIGGGTFTTSNFNITAGNVSASGTAQVLNAGTSTFTLTSTTAIATWAITAGGTYNVSATTVVFSAASTNARTFQGAGLTYGTLTYTVANSLGSLTITGANTFNTINVGSARILTMPASTTNTFTTFNANGVNNGYLYLPGVAGNSASSPDSTPLRIAGDLELVCRVAADSWTPGALSDIITKRLSSATDTAYQWELQSSGKMQLQLGVSSSVINTYVSTVAVPFAGGVAGWVKVTVDVDNGASGSSVQFFTAADSASEPSSWAQLGTTVTLAGVIAINPASAATVSVGQRSNGASEPFAGKFYRAIIRNGIGGTTAFDADFTTKAFGANTFTESSVNAATVTINGTLAQAGDGRVSLVSSTPGTQATVNKAGSGLVTNVDYLSIQDSKATPSSTWYAGTHSILVSNDTGWNTNTTVTNPEGFFHVL